MTYLSAIMTSTPMQKLSLLHAGLYGSVSHRNTRFIYVQTQ